jgi:hypothetical protein
MLLTPVCYGLLFDFLPFLYISAAHSTFAWPSEARALQRGGLLITEFDIETLKRHSFYYKNN